MVGRRLDMEVELRWQNKNSFGKKGKGVRMMRGNNENLNNCKTVGAVEREREREVYFIQIG